MDETRIGPREEMAAFAGKWLAAALRSAAESSERIVFAIPGGRSISGPLLNLAREDLDWSGVELFFVDERHLPLGDKNRNDATVTEHFIDVLVQSNALRAEQVHRAPYIQDDPIKAASRYEQELMDLAGRVDVALLGAGEDGHIASLFPGHETLSQTDPGFAVVEDSPKPPPVRLTMTPGILATASHVCLLFLGSAKARAFSAFCADSTTISQCPARLVKSAPRLLVVADTEASGAKQQHRV